MCAAKTCMTFFFKGFTLPGIFAECLFQDRPADLPETDDDQGFMP